MNVRVWNCLKEITGHGVKNEAVVYENTRITESFNLKSEELIRKGLPLIEYVDL